MRKYKTPQYRTIEQMGLTGVEKGENIQILYQGENNSKIISGVYQGTKIDDWRLKVGLEGKDKKTTFYDSFRVKRLSVEQAKILLGESRQIFKKSSIEQRSLAI